MEDIKVIREKFRKYLYKLVADNKLSKVDADTQYSDADYPRKHADELGINYWEAFRDDASLENLLSILKERFEKEGKNPSTIVSYKRALKSFRNFIEEQYAGVKNMRNGSQKKYYWVCQGQQKEDKKYILAPVDNFHHHKRVNELKVGDVVISYFNQQVNAISTVIKNPEIIKNGNDDWYKAVLDYKELDKPIPKSVIKNIMKNNNIKSFIYGPFDVNYDYNQGYLFNFSKELLDLILENDQEVKIMKSSRKEEKQPLNQILYGPPGTGKTYNTVIKAMEIINPNCLEYDEKGKVSNYFDVKKEFDKAKDNHQIEFVTFHQSYSYEEFVEGIKPNLEKDGLNYYKPDGIFKKICKNASKNLYKLNNNQKMQQVSFDEVMDSFKEKHPEGSDFENLLNISYEENNLIYHFGMQEQDRKIDLLKMEQLFNLNKQYRTSIDFNNEYGGNVSLKGYYHTFYKELLNIKNALEDENQVAIENNKEYIVDENAPKYVLIIDEINRGNISKIFGELITLIEPDKRKGSQYELKVSLPYSPNDELFGVPKNLYIIGTMNTSDRSIASIDIALRRRFKFKEMMPNSSLVADFGIGFNTIFDDLNNKIKLLLDRDHQIGHSYFINTKYNNNNGNNNIETLKDIWFSEILPLLNEYFYCDWEKLKLIIPGFIQKLDVPEVLKNECDDSIYEFKTFDEVADFEKALNQEKFEQV